MMRLDEWKAPELSEDLFYKNVANKILTPILVIQLHQTETWLCVSFKVLQAALMQLGLWPSRIQHPGSTGIDDCRSRSMRTIYSCEDRFFFFFKNNRIHKEMTEENYRLCSRRGIQIPLL